MTWKSAFMSLIGVTLIFLVSPAPVLPSPQTPEFLINEFTTGSQWYSDATTLANGEFVTVWSSERVTSAGNYEIRGRIHGQGGIPAGPEFVVADTWNSLIRPAVAARPDGSFVVAWNGRQQGSPDYAVNEARILATDGTALSPVIPVSDVAIGGYHSIDVVAFGDGSFNVVYAQNAESGGAIEIVSRRVSADGTPSVDEELLTAAASGQFGLSRATMGSYLLSWLDYHGGLLSTHVRRIASDNSPSGGIVLPGDGVAFQNACDVDQNDQGDFAVAWARSDDIFVQTFAADGTPLSGTVQANQLSSYKCVSPHISMDGDGDFVVAWTYGTWSQWFSTAEVYARTFGADSAPIGGEFMVNEVTEHQQKLEGLTLADNGQFLVTWNTYLQDGDGLAVMGRLYHEDIVPVLIVDLRAEAVLVGVELDWRLDRHQDVDRVVLIREDRSSIEELVDLRGSVSEHGRYLDRNIAPGQAATYVLQVEYGPGDTVVKRIESPGVLPPDAVGIASVHPNPFNPSTTISFRVADATGTSLGIYDVAGRIVRSIPLEPSSGFQQVVWDGRDSDGRALPSGVYMVRLSDLDRVTSRRITLAR